MRIQNALLLLISIFKHKKRKEVCIKARSPLASHSLEGHNCEMVYSDHTQPHSKIAKCDYWSNYLVEVLLNFNITTTK